MATQHHIDAQQIQVQVINQTSPYLGRVKELWRAHSTTLGFFPDGAFNDYAASKHVLVAIEPQTKQCVGYLLYRVSGHRAIIVHLCVDPAWRQHGVAHRLVDALANITHDLYGIGLKCRRDFDATLIWPRLGFIAQQEIPYNCAKLPVTDIVR